MEKIFWCSVCDYNQVNYNKPETGSFYGVSGEVHPVGKSWYEQEVVDSRMVVFAVCPECKVEEVLHKFQPR